nr:heparan-alpha-glucosaminide N-acetyltransferase [uncultured Roseateles sp.]
MPARPAAPPTARHARLDALRGLAMVWMTAFHFSFDLNHFGWIRQDFYRDPFWTWQRTCIVSLFLLCAGMGQAVAVQQGQPWPRFWRRWGQVVLGALLVSLGSWLMFPRSFITFGVLHGMAVMLLLLRWAGPRLPGAALLALAALALAAPSLWQHPWFDTRWTNWLGLITHKPVTEDYVPVLPWLGVMLLGFALGRGLAARRGWLDAGLPGLLRPLAWLGQWSLSYYLLHQPVLIGALMMLGGMGLAR